MKLNQGLLFWGLALVTAGAVALAAQQGYLDKTALADLWRLWPVILIAIGVSVVLSRTPFAVVGTLVAALVVGTAGGALIAVGPQMSLNCGGALPTSLTTEDGEFGSTADVSLDFNCGTLNLDVTDDDGWTVESGRVDGDPARITADGDTLRVQTADESAWPDAGRQLWNVSLPSTTTYDLDINPNAFDANVNLAGGTFTSVSIHPNAGSFVLDLTDAEVADLELSLNAGSASITIGGPMEMGGTLSVNAGSIELCTADDVAIRLVVEDNITFSTNLEDSGLTQSGNTWSTSGFTAAADQVTLNISGNAGSFALNPEGGCE
jgi:hypothetical protein